MTSRLLARWNQDLGARFPRRLSKNQKKGFLKAIEVELQTRNFETEHSIIQHWGISNRLLVTKCEDPAVIFMAHYDTPTIMPYGFSLIYKFFGHTRQGISMIITVILMVAIFAFYSLLVQLKPGFWGAAYLILATILFVIPFFFPNPHNSEDNTSGVLGLLAIADWAKDKACKGHIQFVFLDNEEWGLIGSNAIKKHWNKTGHLNSNTIIINLDCVSRGVKPLIIHHNNDCVAQEVLPFLQAHLPQAEIFDMKGFPLSDNYTFRNRGAIDISYADLSIVPGGYYIPRIHSPMDNDFSSEKTALLIDGLTDYLRDRLINSAST